jgi:hypothetical protein
MQGNDKLLKVLDGLLADEVTAIVQYSSRGRKAGARPAESGKVIWEMSVNENHGDWL